MPLVHRDAVPEDDICLEFFGRSDERDEATRKVVLVCVQPADPLPGGAGQRLVQRIRLTLIGRRLPSDPTTERPQDVEGLVLGASILDEVLRRYAFLRDDRLDRITEEPAVPHYDGVSTLTSVTPFPRGGAISPARTGRLRPRRIGPLPDIRRCRSPST